MAPVGKIYTFPNNPRVAKSLIAAAYNGLEVELPEFEMGKDNKTPEFLAKFPLGKVPAFEGTDGTLLFESGAIAYYIASYKDDTLLLGQTKSEAGLVQQWVHFSDNELTPNISTWTFPILGFLPYNKPAHEKAVDSLRRALSLLDKHLLTRTYLVSERVTFADIVVATALIQPYTIVFDKEFRREYANVTRWFVTAVNQEQFKAVVGEVPLCEVAQKYVAPKKEEKKKEKKEEKQKEEKPKGEKPKEEKKKKKKEEEEEEDFDDEPKPEPKAKSALDLLPPSPLVLDEWKRFYSNNNTIPEAMNWLWEHFDPVGWSIWKVNYKYNDELTLIFMSSNLIGGFFNRLERARKYAFGSLIVTGENNNNAIAGYFIIRGQEIPEEVTDAADFESYTFVKVDSALQEVREDIARYFAWTVPGFQDGKVYK
ncbi:hypothetical protein BC937DRAFT_93329 [Endogone sp. FLAS-F59071]|nr:hypothetical protein BC937DRAFT_93329 [Endogone sp. FLAS-F59071]|eukprot:RUS14795.1 hypothetical protein BC937DRAFT_93329 [Endogone sp. FLAS-F59071]